MTSQRTTAACPRRSSTRRCRPPRNRGSPLRLGICRRGPVRGRCPQSIKDVSHRHRPGTDSVQGLVSGISSASASRGSFVQTIHSLQVQEGRLPRPQRDASPRAPRSSLQPRAGPLCRRGRQPDSPGPPSGCRTQSRPRGSPEKPGAITHDGESET
jgi:hypothetical protein